MAAGVFLLRGYDAALGRDSAIYAYSGQLVADGTAPYVDLLNRAGPLAQLVPGAGAAIGRTLAVDDLLAMRVTMTVLSAFAVWTAYVLGRELYGSRLAGALTAASLLALQGFVVYATDGPREKTTVVLLVLLALLAVVRRQWARAGLATALVTLTWQGALFPVATVALVAVVLMPPGRARAVAVLRYTGSGLAVAGATVLGFWAWGALPELYEGFYVVNAGYSTPGGLLTPRPDLVKQLVSGFGWSLAVLALGLVGTLVLGAHRLRRLDRDDGARVASVGLGAGVLVAAGWALLSFQGWPDALVFAPFAACGAAGPAYLLLARRPPPLRRSATLLLAGAAVTAAAVTTVTADPPRLEPQQQQVDAVVDRLDDPVLVAVGHPAPLVLAGLRNPLRYPLVEGPQRRYLEATHPGGLAGVGAEIGDIDPTVITVRNQPGSWLRPVLQESYARVGGARLPYSWWVSRTATTREQRVSIRQALAPPPAAAGAADLRRSVT